MVAVVRWGVVVLLVAHGLIHLLGVAKGMGWARLEQLREPISPVTGVGWAVAAALVLSTGVMIAVRAPNWWWAVSAAAAVVSQSVIVASWSDAKAGTVVNVVLVLAAIVGFAASGPSSYSAQWADRVDAALAAAPTAAGVVTEADLAPLPAPLAAYLRRSGAVGKPPVRHFYATLHGRIRSGPRSEWMPFTARQLNTFGANPQRLFYMDATKSGLPVTVFHDYHDASATMQGKALFLVPVLDASGPQMDQGETVTVFNDMAVFAPSALLDAQLVWQQLDPHRVQGVFTNGDQTVRAELVFSPTGDLIDFISDDRLAASSDGKSFTAQRWNTPISDFGDVDGRRVAVAGKGQWQAPEPDGHFTYIELNVDRITYNRGLIRDEAVTPAAPPPGSIRERA